MGLDSLPNFVVEHVQRIAKDEGFVDGYDVKLEDGEKVGDGFCSTLLSITLIGNRHCRDTNSETATLSELPLICKLQPLNESRKEILSSELMFQREVYMYTKLLPALAAFQEEHKVPVELALTALPKCYAAFHENGNSKSVIILEDLRKAGYSMWDKNKSIDCETIRLVMEQLGRLHGLSIAIRDQRPEVFNDFQIQPNHMLDIFEGFKSLLRSSFAVALPLMDSVEDAETIKRFDQDYTDVFSCGLDEKKLGKYGVISHGDFYRNNMMFAFENVRFIGNICIL